MPAATLTFTAFQLPDGDSGHPPAEIVKIRYFPKIGADGATIELHREQSDLPFVENKIPLRESPVADRLRGFRVEVYDGTTWLKEWPAGGRLEDDPAEEGRRHAGGRARGDVPPGDPDPPGRPGGGRDLVRAAGRGKP